MTIEMERLRHNPKIHWFLKGMRVLFTLPALTLACAIIGFAGFAIEVGIPMPEVVAMNFFIWALPAKLIMVSSILSGTSIAATFIAVTLSSIRFMPMTASIVPEMRTKDTRTWILLILSHFVAITGWLYAFENFKNVPRENRTVYFAGVGGSLFIFNTLLVAIGYPLIETFPPYALAALFLLTPVYFLLSLWRSARNYSIYLAMGFGIVLGPIFSQFFPQIDILLGGFVGGSLATLIYAVVEHRRVQV
jgi:predicted branched-subunit amino acid permease